MKRRGSVLTLLIQMNSGLNLLELVKDEGIGLVTIRMVVRKCAQSLGLLALAHEVTWGFGYEPDEEELEERRDGLEDGWNAP